MSDTPRTDAKESETERGCYINGRSDREGWERHAHYGWKHARALERELAAVTAERDDLQAKLDSLMLEFCPEEVTVEQRFRWESAQARVTK